MQLKAHFRGAQPAGLRHAGRVGLPTGGAMAGYTFARTARKTHQDGCDESELDGQRYPFG
jgi:hypothetical protein